VSKKGKAFLGESEKRGKKKTGERAETERLRGVQGFKRKKEL